MKFSLNAALLQKGFFWMTFSTKNLNFCAVPLIA